MKESYENFAYEDFSERTYPNDSMKVASQLPARLKTIMFDNLGI